MKKIFHMLNKELNKSAIYDFRRFLYKYRDVHNWMIFSDYCVGDKNKPNDVLSFTIFPHILAASEWNDVMNTFQKSDFKDCRHISDNFCNISKQGYYFTFSFIC